VVGCRRQFANRATCVRGGRLLPRRRAYNILVGNRFVIALFLALKV
jgi:hypothetical protein